LKRQKFPKQRVIPWSNRQTESVPLPIPEPGLVISFAYLWADQRMSGAQSGQKVRPTVIIMSVVSEDDRKLVYVAPITHAKPTAPDEAVEIPLRVKRRLQLDELRSWVVTTELNCFTWPGYDLAPISRDKPQTFDWGFLPVELFAEVKRSVVRNNRSKRMAVTGRD
jgi:hypothetical protein